MEKASTTVEHLAVDGDVERLVGRLINRAGALVEVLTLVVRRTGEMTFDQAMESLSGGELRGRKGCFFHDLEMVTPCGEPYLFCVSLLRRS